MSQINGRITLKIDTEYNWTTNNPVLMKGELVVVSDYMTYDSEGDEQYIFRLKMGDGESTFRELPYLSDSFHEHSADDISGGTFTGTVFAQRLSPFPTIYQLRNSCLSTSEGTPSYNGEICWVYE